MLIEVIKELCATDGDIIIIGSAGWYLSGVDKQPKDIDIIVKDTTLLETILDIKKYEAKGLYSLTEKRAYSNYKGYLIDIFVGEVSNDIETKEIDGVKITYQTMKGYIDYCERTLFRKRQHPKKEVLMDKLRLAQNYI